MNSNIKKIFWRWLEFLKIAFDSIRAHRLRSLLTVIGVVIGVAVVTIVAALLEGAGNFVISQTVNFAPNVVRIDKAAFQDFAGDGQAFVTALSKRPNIYPDELEVLKNRFQETLEIGGLANGGLPVRRGEKTLNGINVQGVTPNITSLTSVKIANGRELTETDNQFRSNVCVIGTDIVDELFPNLNPLGKEIRIGQLPFMVVGIAEPRGSLFGSSQDGFVMIPLDTFSRVFGERSRSISILAQAKPNLNLSVADTEETVRVGMRQLRKLKFADEDNFSLTTAKSVQAFTDTLTGLIGTITYPLTIIALVVGGVVVMNMMLASVTERTKEVGIRMALGARRSDILTQFLFEATLLTLFGGILGLVLAAVLVWVVALITKLPIFLPIWAAFMAIAISCLVGVVFGVLPARRAAKLDPIEALRSE
ncbi:MAG TPA: ABC transporter permease [Pyrinomonadaceae bacterium]|nr:ABC transporter permease [Pyrinomonadaceae bacterium]